MTERKFALSMTAVLSTAFLLVVSTMVGCNVHDQAATRDRTVAIAKAADPIAAACAVDSQTTPPTLCVIHATKKAAQ